MTRKRQQELFLRLHSLISELVEVTELGFYEPWEELVDDIVIPEKLSNCSEKQYKQIKSVLTYHQSLILDANDKLANFIRNNFSLTDVLYC
ncbi:MAG: hypothetical protein HC930_15095 [Hydrococcus sp. SU_1_0]|nr:hypothetical protein [Hydrococcus sp. SU_1_0]